MKIGIDLIEIERISKSINNDHFIERVFSPSEINSAKNMKQVAQYYAGRFCVKEAFSKAIGTGVRGFSLNEVSTLNNSLGAPYLVLTGKALEVCGVRKINVSISHTEKYATAIVMIED